MWDGDRTQLFVGDVGAFVEAVLLQSSWGLIDISRSEQVLVAVQHGEQFLMGYGQILAHAAMIGKAYGATFVIQLLRHVNDVLSVCKHQICAATLVGIHVG